MPCRGIRGATVAEANTRPAILAATRELLEAIIAANGVQPDDVASVFFTTSPDLTADYPALAAASDGSLWAAWVSYDGKGERLLAARVTESGAAPPMEVTAGEVFRPQVAADGGGRVWVVWSEQRDDNWDLYARAWNGNRWSAVERLTSSPGPDIYASLAAGPGGLWLAWQGVRNGATTDIFLKSCRDGKWAAEEIAVGSHPANDWEPALAVHGNTVYVAWDSYRNGAHDVYLARFDGRRVSEPQRLTGGDRFHARASLAADAHGRLWVAWEEGDERWGLDTVQVLGGLERERRVRIYCLEGGRLRAPAQALEPAPWTGSIAQCPRLHMDARGCLWVFYRVTYMQRLWQAAASFYEGSRWSEPLVLDRSFGRQSVAFASAAAKDGALWVAYAGDDRTERRPFDATHNNVYAARFPAPAGASAELAAGAEVAVPPSASRPYARTWPQHQVQIGGKTYRLVWGELHRHTDIDHHGRPDGSLEDAYRYARDPAGLDFIATTDHIAPAPAPSGINPMTWWRSQKFADLHRVAGAFEPLYAYETSRNWPQGHRNVVYPRRGGIIFGGLAGPTENDPRPLWKALRAAPVPSIAIPHQLTGPPVDWSLHDPELTPVMEIYQSRRQNYEYDGAPQPPGVEQVWGKKDGSWAWDALAKGRKTGFIASSDHMSTHMAFAAAYVENLSREGVFEALTKRRTYGASDYIVLDFRLLDGDRFMGEEARVTGPPHFRIRVIGAAPVETVEIVRNAKFVFSQNPGARKVDLEFVDNQPPPEAYYYLRVRQRDRQMAWSSPIWLQFR